MTSIKRFAFGSLFVLATLTTAHATPTLQIELQSGSTTIFSPTGPSPLTFSSAIGVFNTTVNTGFASSVPSIDLSSLDVSSIAAGTLTIKLSATGFTNPIGAQNWLSKIDGNWSTGASTITFHTYLDNNNVMFGTGTPLSSLLDTISATGGSSAIAAAPILDDPFSLTEVLTITTSAPGFVSTDSSLTGSIPEPGSLAVLATGMAAIGVAARRRKSTPTA